jgi:hypothetical protein
MTEGVYSTLWVTTCQSLAKVVDVIPAQAGIHIPSAWIPAFAGMTRSEGVEMIAETDPYAYDPLS